MSRALRFIRSSQGDSDKVSLTLQRETTTDLYEAHNYTEDQVDTIDLGIHTGFSRHTGVSRQTIVSTPIQRSKQQSNVSETASMTMSLHLTTHAFSVTTTTSSSETPPSRVGPSLCSRMTSTQTRLPSASSASWRCG